MIDDLVAQYLIALKAEGRAAKALAWHRESLALFGRWLADAELPVDPDRWTSALVRRYIDFAQERPGRGGRPLSPTSVNTRLRSLRAFVNWLEGEELIARNPFDRTTCGGTRRRG